MKVTGGPFCVNLFRGANDLNYLSIQLRDKNKKVWKIRLGEAEHVLAQVDVMSIFQSQELVVESNELLESIKKSLILFLNLFFKIRRYLSSMAKSRKF